MITSRTSLGSVLPVYKLVCDSCLSRPWGISQRSFSSRSRTDITKSHAQFRTIQYGQRTRIGPRTSRAFSTSYSQRSDRHGTRQLLPKGPARTRFAPSPTGFLHLGSLRTALFNYLLARKTGGQFILRVEDTDQKRLVQGAEQRLYDDLRWAGLQWDEGPEVGGPFGPYKQSERTALYRKHAEMLLEAGAAYRCFCQSSQAASGPVDLSQIAASAGGCQSNCRSIPSAESSQRAGDGDRHVVRFDKPKANPRWSDLVYGKMSPDNARKFPSPGIPITGVILLKGDGTPTYHLANVVDDHAMEITHVIRGTEWMPSTALHVAIYNAFGWQHPEFAHVGLLTDEAQNKLSKRNFDTDVKALREKNGILPESLTNFLALLGWRNPQRNDVMKLEELVDRFDLKFTRGNTIVSLDKLWYLQRNHARSRIDKAAASSTPTADFDRLVSLVLEEVKARWSSSEMQSVLGTRDIKTYIEGILLIDRGTFDNPKAYVNRNIYFFTEVAKPTAASLDETDHVITQRKLDESATGLMTDPEIRQALQLQLSDSEDGVDTLWEKIGEAASRCNALLNKICLQRAAEAGAVPQEDAQNTAEYKAWVKALHANIRGRLTGGVSSPSTGLVMAVLGHDECKKRLTR